ncbi:hypothetical protein ACFSHT_15715 [Paraburkholderia silviterrae]|uniref:Uncharacterized protein n=1 Tax=Paraburkholderia silviterrae TaxID=2528715 RepID=A0A4R5M9G5_9BURK|nr:hypothetical protein [Paraburkholderia silviterrae]TDG23259.1 hypothetical protein EYW47_15115 [Paraburkholderia silviterrae]
MNEYLIALARAAGLTIKLDGVIGNQQYMSVTGTLDALRRFGDAYSARLQVERVEAQSTESKI